MHFAHDVAATNKLPFDVDLRDCGPVRVFLDLLPDLLVRKHVDVFELLDSVGLEKDGNKAREPALRHLLGPFHEHNHVVLFDPLVEGLC